MTENNNTEVKKQIQGAVNPVLKQTKYTKQYYVMFFAIMVTAFIFMFWLCNYTRLKEMFQIVLLTALAIAIAEYTTRKYLKL